MARQYDARQRLIEELERASRERATPAPRTPPAAKPAAPPPPPPAPPPPAPKTAVELRRELEDQLRLIMAGVGQVK